jgi:uncharacterized protein
MSMILTASGREIDLLDPGAAEIDFARDVAPALARIPRFLGHTLGSVPYSVAQHCVLGASLIEKERWHPDWAATFLLHDAHKAFLGDVVRPVADALDRALVKADGEEPSLFSRAIGSLKAGLDRRIHEAAGIALPDETAQGIVADTDLRMLRAERERLLPRARTPWHPAIENARPLSPSLRIEPWPFDRAAERWLETLRGLCPDAVGL